MNRIPCFNGGAFGFGYEVISERERKLQQSRTISEWIWLMMTYLIKVFQYFPASLLQLL